MAGNPLNNYCHDYQLSQDNVKLNGYISKQGVINFLGVPYAQVHTRFRPAKPLTLKDLPNFDATQFGPRCHQKPDMMASHLSHLYEAFSAYTEEDKNCLNLNIYTTGVDKKVPVFVWIHGGGFNTGDNTTQFNGNHLVQRSLQCGKPIIVVAINYRLNIFGFTSSKELEEESNSLRESHIRNLGLQDQRAALQWIQSEIHYFGGDPNQVTLGGESAGAMSIYCHLKAGLELFQQVIIESPPEARLRSVNDAQLAFDKLVKASPAHTDEKLSILRSLSAKALLNLSDNSISFPIDDPAWFGDEFKDATSFWTFPTWCRRAIMGNTRDETGLLLAISERVPYEAIIGFTKALVPEAVVPDNIMNQTCTKEELVSWSTHMSFIGPTISTAKQASSRGTPIFIYRLDCIDPVPGPLQDISFHTFGITFTFDLPPLRAYPELAVTQDRMSFAFLDMFYGTDPWERYDVAHRMMSWHGSETKMVSIQ